MPATPQPMSIYHPDAARPRRVKTAKPRSSQALPALSWQEMAKAEGHRPGFPVKGKHPHTLSGQIRRLLRAAQIASRADIARALEADDDAVGKSLSDMAKRGHVIYDRSGHGWRLTSRGRDAT